MVKKWKTIMDLRVQEPKDKIIFSNEDLVWSEVNGNKLSIDRVARISLVRFPDFIRGDVTSRSGALTKLILWGHLLASDLDF